MCRCAECAPMQESIGRSRTGVAFDGIKGEGDRILFMCSHYFSDVREHDFVMGRHERINNSIQLPTLLESPHF